MENKLEKLMKVLDVKTEKELWEAAPKWAQYAVRGIGGRVGFLESLEGGALIQLMEPDSVPLTLSEEHRWTMRNVISERPSEEEEYRSLDTEIIYTIEVLNTAGNAEEVKEEFRHHLFCLLAIQRENWEVK